MLNAETCKLLDQQVAALAQASRDLQGIGLAAKTYNWPGLHKVAMKMSKGADLEEHTTIKFIRDYGDELVDLPGVRSSPCDWATYPEMWKRVQAIAMATQDAWKKIAKAAEENGDTDADDFVDKRLRAGVKEVLHLNRWMKYLEQAGDDVAAFRVFDNKRA